MTCHAEQFPPNGASLRDGQGIAAAIDRTVRNGSRMDSPLYADRPDCAACGDPEAAHGRYGCVSCMGMGRELSANCDGYEPQQPPLPEGDAEELTLKAAWLIARKRSREWGDRYNEAVDIHDPAHKVVARYAQAADAIANALNEEREVTG